MSRRQRERRLLQAATVCGFVASVVMSIAAVAIGSRETESARNLGSVASPASLVTTPAPSPVLVIPSLDMKAVAPQISPGSLDVLIQGGPETSLELSEAAELMRARSVARASSRSL